MSVQEAAIVTLPPCLRVNAPNVIGESVDGETLIVNLDTGAYYSATGVGDAVWTLIAEAAPTDAIVDAIADRSGAPRDDVAAAVTALVRELLDEGLVVSADGGIPAGAVLTPNGSARGPLVFERPVLHKYTDMQDLLLLDPVHEVDDAGWPSALPQG